MRLCLAGLSSFPYLEEVIRDSRFQLESYFYFEDWQKSYIHDLDLFLLDSGAFSFMNAEKKNTGGKDWNTYLNDYIKFINENDIQYFFELDIDYVIGYEKTLELTRRLEAETHKPCIPVFHKKRGFEEWEKMCNEYDYVAIGTMKEYLNNMDVLRYLVNYANKCGTKVHGLGFTRRAELPRLHFYSVDSTSWHGARFGQVYEWDAVSGQMLKHESSNYKGKKMRLGNSRPVVIHNFKEWCKFQQFAFHNY